MATMRIAWGILIAAMLAGCAGSPLGETAPVATADMTGRWILAAPNAPSCGVNMNGAPGAQQGSIVPEGGCPGNFYTSRHWSLDAGTLTIVDDENLPLASLTLAGGHFEGQATTSMPVTLSRVNQEPQ
jgi:hypothetical protein